jgi:hypothetical protein
MKNLRLHLSQFLSNLLRTPEQDRHEEILRKYTLPERHTLPRHLLHKAV